MRRLPVARLRSLGGVAASGLLLALAAGPALAAPGEFRLFVEGEAGVRNEGDYGRISRTGSGDPVDPVLRTDDQAVGRAGLNFQLSYQRERLQLAMGYSPAYERGFDDPDRLSGVSHRLDFGLVGDLNQRLRLTVREQLFSSPTLDLYSPNSADTNAAPSQGDQLVHHLDIRVDSALSRRTSLSAGVSQGLRQYQGSDLADSQDLIGRLGAGFDFNRSGRIEVSADAGRYDYGERGEADIRSASLAWARELGRSSRVRLEAGAYSADSTLRLTSVEGEPFFVERSDQGWRGGAQFSQDRRLFHWGLGLSHDISPGAGLGRAAQADNAFLGISTTTMGRRLTLGLDANGSRQRDLSGDRGDLGTLGSDHGTLTEYAAGTASAGWSFGQVFRVSGGYSRVWQRSNVEPFPDLSYGRYFLNLAFRIYSRGETPQEPEHLGEPVDEEPDAQ
jgi:hypothetical protein